MNTPDDFPQYHAELLDGIYDCVDRIVLNAFFPLGQTGGGMRSWWRSLHGDDSRLDDKHLCEMAGTFSRRLHALCGKQGIPIIEARSGERKHELAESHVPKDPTFRGLFLVITGNAPAPTWEVKRNSDGRITEERHRKNWPLVKHYYFHIMDREWGHVTIRMCGYPPFGAQLILNGHESVKREARRKCLTTVKDGNCFVEGDFAAVNRAAARSHQENAIGRFARALRAMDLLDLPLLCAHPVGAKAQHLCVSVFGVGTQSQSLVLAWHNHERGVPKAHRPHARSFGSKASQNHLRLLASPASHSKARTPRRAGGQVGGGAQL
jgi:hypothetical protein